MLGNVVLSARHLHRGQYEAVALGPFPSVSANISGGLRLRFCFPSLADVCFNLIKRLTGLSGGTRASVGPSPGGQWGGWGKAPWAPSPGHQGQLTRGVRHSRLERGPGPGPNFLSPHLLSSFLGPYSHRVPTVPHTSGSETSVSTGKAPGRLHSEVLSKNCLAVHKPQSHAKSKAKTLETRSWGKTTVKVRFGVEERRGAGLAAWPRHVVEWGVGGTPALITGSKPRRGLLGWAREPRL